MTPNPALWPEDEESPDGVFVGSEPALNLLGLPQGLRARRPASEALAGVVGEARALLGDVVTSLRALGRGEDARARFPLAGLAPSAREALLDLLGEGEVTGLVTNGRLHQISETIFPGLWRVMPEDAPEAEWLETGDAPALVREAAAGAPFDWLPLEHIVPPDGTMNVMGVLSEVRTRARAWRPGDPNHVMNFTLLPMTEADAAFLALMLGEGPARLSSGGYGSARVLATALKRVWAVQFLNSMGVVILDTLEIGDLPGAACAQRQDFEDSAARIADLIAGGLA